MWNLVNFVPLKWHYCIVNLFPIAISSVSLVLVLFGWSHRLVACFHLFMLSLLTSTPLFSFRVPKVDEPKRDASIDMQNFKDST
jgi:hypothetical protein